MRIKKTIDEYYRKRFPLLSKVIRLARCVADPLNTEPKLKMAELREAIHALDTLETPEQTLLKELSD